MGNFGGHALPGSFFIVFGLWWTVQILHRYYMSKSRNSRFTSSCIFNCSCLCGRLKDWPIEAYFKLICIGIGFFLEMWTGFSDDWHFVNLGNGQHATMFFFFGLTGVIDIMMYHRCNLPPDMDYVSVIMALVVEFVLFRFHLHGRKDLDVLLHTLLLYTIAAGIMSVVLELKYRNNVLCALSRCYFVILQGTWFWQVGWILYPPFEGSYKWDLEDHDQMMIATMIFAWHAAFNLLVMLSIGGLVSLVHRKMFNYRNEDRFAMKRLIHNNGDSVLHMHNESESETEFERPMLS